MITAKRITLAILAGSLLSTVAVAGPMADSNCMFRSAVAHKGGEATRTSIYNSDETTKYQWCSPTASNDPRPETNDQAYRDRHVRGYNAGEYNTTAPAAGY